MCRVNTNDTGENTCIAAVQNSDLRHSGRRMQSMQRRADNNKIISILRVASCNLKQHLLTSKGVRTRSPTTRTLNTSTSSDAPPTPPILCTSKHLIVHDTGGGWRGGRRKETVTLHQSPVTPRHSVLSHGHATDEASPLHQQKMITKVSTVNHSNISGN